MILERLVLAFSVLLYATIIVLAYIESLVGLTTLRDWIYAHETLTTGILALASAITGAFLLNRQTMQSERHERQRQHRRREAVRTVLPLALSSIGRYAEASAAATRQLLDQCVDESLPARSELRIPDLAELPTDAISIIQDLAEVVTPEEVRALGILLADLQVQSSRLSKTIANAGRSERAMAKPNLEEYIIDCAMIYARAESMFNFGRRRTDTLPSSFTWQRVHGALFKFGMYGSEYDEIRETILRRSGENLSSFVEDRWSAVG